MAEELFFSPNASRTQIYEELLPQISAILADEPDGIANMANVAAMLKTAFGFFWVGFYRTIGNELVLSPFQGSLACTRIALGKGVCGHVARSQRTEIVPNVHLFPGHIVCSSLSQSEIVVPYVKNGKTLFVLDIDSDQLADFSSIDQLYLEQIVEILGDRSQWEEA